MQDHHKCPRHLRLPIRQHRAHRPPHAIAGQLGSAGLVTIQQARALYPFDFALLVGGGPTHMHGTSLDMRALLDGMPREPLHSLPAAAFDIRFRMSRLLGGFASMWIAGRLQRLGTKLILPPESFFIGRDLPPRRQKSRHHLECLEAGEEERAAAWARTLLDRLGVTPAF